MGVMLEPITSVVIGVEQETTHRHTGQRSSWAERMGPGLWGPWGWTNGSLSLSLCFLIHLESTSSFPTRGRACDVTVLCCVPKKFGVKPRGASPEVCGPWDFHSVFRGSTNPADPSGSTIGAEGLELSQDLQEVPHLESQRGPESERGLEGNPGGLGVMGQPGPWACRSQGWASQPCHWFGFWAAG